MSFMRDARHVSSMAVWRIDAYSRDFTPESLYGLSAGENTVGITDAARNAAESIEPAMIAGVSGGSSGASAWVGTGTT